MNRSLRAHVTRVVAVSIGGMLAGGAPAVPALAAANPDQVPRTLPFDGGVQGPTPVPLPAAPGSSGAAPQGTPAAPATRQIVSADTQLASVVPGQNGQPTTVMITSALGSQLAIAPFRAAGAAIQNVAPAPVVIATGRVFYTDQSGIIYSLTPHTAAPVRYAVLPGMLPRTRVTLAVSPSGAQILASAVTTPTSPLIAADERLFSIAAGSDPVLLHRNADMNWFDGGVPELTGWDSVGPVEVTNANLLSPHPEHGSAFHLDPITGDTTGQIGGDQCILLAQTKGGSSLCGASGSLVLNIENRQGKRFWRAVATDQWVDQTLLLSPDAARVAGPGRVFDYRGEDQKLPPEFTPSAWIDATHLLGVSTATGGLAIVDVTSIQRATSITVQGRPAGVVAPDDVITTDPPVKPPPPPPAAAKPAPAPSRDLTRVYLALTLLAVLGGGFVYYRRNRAEVDAKIDHYLTMYREYGEEQRRKKLEALRPPPKARPLAPRVRPVYSRVVVGPDFSLGLDESGRRLVMHDPQSFSNFVMRWLAQEAQGQDIVGRATPDLAPGTPHDARLERAAQRLAMSPAFGATSRTLIVPWLSLATREREVHRR
jgi:hypothetical protein